MAVWDYSFKFKERIPFLTDEEFDKLFPLFLAAKISLQQRDNSTRVTESGCKSNSDAIVELLDYYYSNFGYKFDKLVNFYDVKLSSIGCPCPICNKPFRTPKAKLCAECGHELPDGKVAGPYPV